jgi:hypothetical protein
MSETEKKPRPVRDWRVLATQRKTQMMSHLWLPIAALVDRYEQNLLLCAPELVDLDCNPDGIGIGHWQDDALVPCGPDGAIGSFLACRWSMSCEEWYEVPCRPTHFIKMTGPNKTITHALAAAEQEEHAS